MPDLTLARLLFASVLLRVVFLLYGLYQDTHSALPYTDIDYFVFTDASRALSQGQSPYKRETYRYTPLLAYFLYPTIIPGFFTFGKLLFAFSDIVAGYGIFRILRDRIPHTHALRYTAAIWLLNPMVATISTRGSSEGLLGVMVTLLLWASLSNMPLLSGVLLGLSAHFKIYPIIYYPSILLALDRDDTTSILAFVQSLVTRRRLVFTLSAFATFALLNIAMYAVYGFEFLHHTYLHHVSRLDHRHNFSPYHVLLYLISSPEGRSSIPFAQVAFLPQMLLSAVLIPLVCAKRDLAGTLFVQTFAFVTFNKVCTSQYFMWYIVLLPFVLPHSQLLQRWSVGVLALVAWVGTQAAWLAAGYNLEFLGQSTFVPGLWLAALSFFAVNVWLVSVFVQDVVSPSGRRPEPGAVKRAIQKHQVGSGGGNPTNRIFGR